MDKRTGPDISRHEIATTPETPEAFREGRRRFTAITKDRNGWIGKTDIETDSRVAEFHFDYRRKEHDPDNLAEVYPFVDDHYRGINQNFQKGRGKMGGRDDRDFYIPRSPEMQKKYDELRARRLELGKEISELRKKLHPYFKAEVIVPRLSTKDIQVHHESDEDEVGRETDTVTEYYFYWAAAAAPDSKTVHTLEHISFSPRNMSEAMDMLQRMSKEGPPASAQEAFKLFQEGYKKRWEELGLGELSNEYREIVDEIAKFDRKETQTVNINLYPPESAENNYLKKYLGTRESAFLQDQDLEIGNEEQLLASEADRQESEKAQALAKEKEAERQAYWENYIKEQEERLRSEEAARKRLREEQEAIERQKKQAVIEAEMTPDLENQISEKLVEMETLIKLIRTFPSKHAELKKLKSKLPNDAPRSMNQAFKQHLKGKELIPEADKIIDYINQLAGREKINQAIPGFQDSVREALENVKHIPQIVDRHNEAEMVLDDELISRDELITKTRKTFLEDPWNQQPEEIVDKIVEDVVEHYG